MKTSEISIGRLRRTLAAGVLALLLVVGLSLMLARFEALAQPAAPNGASLEVDKQVSKAQARPGDTLAYTITVHNSGDAPTDVLITDELSSELIYISGTFGANYGDGTVLLPGGVISWNDSVGVDQTARLWFSAQIFTETTATEIQNTAYVTGTGSVISDSCQTTIISGQIHSQIRSPNRDAYITKKGSRTISGIAWQEGVEPPYLTGDVHLEIEPGANDMSSLLSWNQVPSATIYLLEEATTPQFSDAETKHYGPETQKGVSYEEAGTFYYRVTADATGLEASRSSNVVSAAIPWEGTAAGFQGLAPTAAGVTAGESITVQVRVSETGKVESAPWHTAEVTQAAGWEGWDWSYEWDLPQARGTQYVIQARASSEDGAFGDVDAITVTLDNKEYTMFFPLIFNRYPPIPYPPELTLTGKEDERDNTYTLSWTYSDDSPEVQDPDDYAGDSYTLQEATKSDFSDAETIYSGDSKSYDVVDQDDGKYYYRVRGHNDAGAGEWSNVESVAVESFSYFDDFSDYKSGWPREWSDTRGALYQVRPYEHPGCGPGEDCKYGDGDGYVIARRNNSDPFARFGPGVEIPSGNYEIGFKSRWFEAQYHATYQIFFDSDKDFNNFYSIKIMIYDPGVDNACGYQVYGSDGSVNAFGEEIIRELSDFTREKAINCGVRNYNGGSIGNTDWNNWRIRREGNKIKIYVNDEHLGTWTAPAKSHRYFGVGCTLYEGLTPSKPEFDDWSVELLD